MIKSYGRQVFRLVRGSPTSKNAIQTFATSSTVFSGHNRWSKIKHDKGKVDGAKTKQRSALSKELTIASKRLSHPDMFPTRLWYANSSTEHGPDQTANPRLAGLIAAAKKVGFPKASIESAIARGQGQSLSGAALESLTVEVLLPPAIAAIIECQTDSKARTLQDLREVFKDYGATMTPTNYLFERKGRITFEASQDLDEDAFLEQAIEAGALDVERGEDGLVIVYTKPADLTSVAAAMEPALGLKVESSEFIWDPKEDTKVEVDSPATEEKLTKLISRSPTPK